jgi:3-deoxy-D-manno-octulosonic-acid transferase
MFIIYAILIHVIFLLVLPVLVFHPRLREGIRERFGVYPPGWPGRNRRPVIWFHGASAGDLLALQPVIQEVRRLLPDGFMVLTYVTNSGRMVAHERIEGVDATSYLPYDLPWSVGRAVRAIQPDVLVLEYAEIWPALVRQVRKSGARIVLINGRFNERSLLWYRWLYRAIGSPLRHIDRLCMREPVEAQHALEIGGRPNQVRVTGNTKFDCIQLPQGHEHREHDGAYHELAALRTALGLTDSRLVWLAGSTHEGEEELLLDAFLTVRAEFPSLRLVIAPRYIERVPRVQILAHERGLAVGLRSRGANNEPVVLLDSVGELRLAYSLATVVFVGGSFVRRGGQNILEPAGWGKPVLFGPHMENFADSVRVLFGRGGIPVANKNRLVQTLQDLLRQPEEIAKLGELARQTVTSVQGASRINANEIVGLIALPRNSPP